MRRTLAVLALVVVLAGCVGPLGSDNTNTDNDGIGVVDGVEYDSDLAVTVEDGLNETELDRLAVRSMARIEVLRGLNFQTRIPIEILTREEYRERRGDREVSTVRRQWENEVWEATFIVGQDRDVTTVFDETLGETVQGFYSPSEAEIVIVTDREETALSKRTLVHELVHALQDQQFGLDEVPSRQDPSMARNSVVEGEASLIPELYFDRCGGEWSCIEPPRPEDDEQSLNPGLVLVLLQPYEQGPEFVREIRAQDGWAGVDQLHENYPASTAQIIEPERYPDDEPVNVSVGDTSSSSWNRLDHSPVGETIGQAGLYAMFWHNDIIETEDTYSFSHPVVDGWAGDELVPYATTDGQTGHVWEIEWESASAAEQFFEAYRTLLDDQGALERGPRQFVINEGPFQGAFDVRQDGTTVTIVKGPTLDSLSAIHTFREE